MLPVVVITLFSGVTLYLIIWAISQALHRSELLRQLNYVIASEMNLRLLDSKLIKVLTKEMRISKAYFVLESDIALRPVNSLDMAYSPPIFDPRLEKMLHHVDHTLTTKNLVEAVDKELFKDLNISLIVPLKVDQEDVGLLVIGPKLSKRRYAKSETKFLENFAPGAAIALKNADTYRKVQELNRTLEIKVLERTHELEESQAVQLKLKDEFVFIATHDLSTPVAAIAGFTSLINARQENISPELKSYLSAITEASNRLKVLTNDLLQVARSDSGTIKVDLVNVDAKPIIESAVREITIQASAKHVQLFLSLGPDNHVLADPVKLAEIVENLLSNGIKYNREGGSLTISSKVEIDQLILTFKDTGIGIKESEQNKVFTKFFRAEDPAVRKSPGTGLGLFVARMLTEKMGGKISFESIEGQGTIFTLAFKR